MTDTKKINLIREKCIAANPEIVELKFGCEVIWTFEHQLNHRSSTTRHKKGIIFSRNTNPTVFFYGNISLKKDVPLAKLKIFGRPIRLADVVLTLIEADNEPQIVFDGLFIRRATLWNLRVDDLEKQSEETVEFLYQLLK